MFLFKINLFQSVCESTYGVKFNLHKIMFILLVAWEKSSISEFTEQYTEGSPVIKTDTTYLNP
jgi:hypothetical protein